MSSDFTLPCYLVVFSNSCEFQEAFRFRWYLKYLIPGAELGEMYRIIVLWGVTSLFYQIIVPLAWGRSRGRSSFSLPILYENKQTKYLDFILNSRNSAQG